MFITAISGALREEVELDTEGGCVAASERDTLINPETEVEKFSGNVDLGDGNFAVPTQQQRIVREYPTLRQVRLYLTTVHCRDFEFRNCARLKLLWVW